MSTDSHQEPTAAGASGGGVYEFNLASLLNILWRRRLIVLGLPVLGLVAGLLYGTFGTKRWSATANVRPGITSFTAEGGPIRQWQLKDITTWYDKMLYRQELNRRLGLPAKSKTVIRTEFIATGLTNLAGGEVVTLWTTATSPEMAAAILDTSVVLFKAYAENDTLSNQIELTRDGLELQIEILKTRLVSVDKSAASLDLQLGAARAESLVVAVMDQELGIELDKLTRRREFYQRRLEVLGRARQDLQGNLAELDEVLASVSSQSRSADIDPQDIPTWARRDAVLDGGDVYDGLVDVRLRILQKLESNAAAQDSFAFEMEVASLDYHKREIKREATVQSKLREIEQKIGDLALERDYELPIKRQEINNDISSRRVQLGMLTSLQRVGGTIVSDRPVRPRRLRATAILFFLGLIGGLALGFTWDYVSTHRREIFRS